MGMNEDTAVLGRILRYKSNFHTIDEAEAQTVPEWNASRRATRPRPRPLIVTRTLISFATVKGRRRCVW